MYKVHYRIWADDGLVCCEGLTDYFEDAFELVETWLESHVLYIEIARIEFERIDSADRKA